MFLKYTYWISVFFLLILNSCSSPEIPLYSVRQTSDLLHCDKVYGHSLKKIEEENEILIQTGRIDTTTEHPPIRAAIININNSETVLNLLKDNKLNNETNEEYSGGDYYLILSYTEIDPGIFKGTCTITHGKLKSVYKIAGINNRHL